MDRRSFLRAVSLAPIAAPMAIAVAHAGPVLSAGVAGELFVGIDGGSIISPGAFTQSLTIDANGYGPISLVESRTFSPSEIARFENISPRDLGVAEQVDADLALLSEPDVCDQRA